MSSYQERNRILSRDVALQELRRRRWWYYSWSKRQFHESKIEQRRLQIRNTIKCSKNYKGTLQSKENIPSKSCSISGKKLRGIRHKLMLKCKHFWNRVSLCFACNIFHSIPNSRKTSKIFEENKFENVDIIFDYVVHTVQVENKLNSYLIILPEVYLESFDHNL